MIRIKTVTKVTQTAPKSSAQKTLQITQTHLIEMLTSIGVPMISKWVLILTPTKISTVNRVLAAKTKIFIKMTTMTEKNTTN